MGLSRVLEAEQTERCALYAAPLPASVVVPAWVDALGILAGLLLAASFMRSDDGTAREGRTPAAP